MGNSNNRIYDLGYTYRHRLIFNFAALNTTDIEHIVNQAHKIAGALLDFLQTAAHLRLRLLAQRNIRKANNRIHRRPDIMRHVVQEFCFGIIRCLRRLECLLKSLPVLLLLQILVMLNDETHNNSEQDENQQHQSWQQINIACMSSCAIQGQLQPPFAITYLKGISRCIIRQRCAGSVHLLKARVHRRNSFVQAKIVPQLRQRVDRAGKKLRHTQNDYCEAPKGFLPVGLLQINRIAHCNAGTALQQVERPLGDNHIIVACIARAFAARILTMNQIAQARFIALRRINLCNNACRGQLDALDIIGLHTLGNPRKVVNPAVAVNQHLLQRIRNIDACFDILCQTAGINLRVQLQPGLGLLLRSVLKQQQHAARYDKAQHDNQQRQQSMLLRHFIHKRSPSLCF